MPDIAFAVPTEIMFGLEVVNRLASGVARLGERVLLVTETILYEGKTIERIQALLDKKSIQYIVYDEVMPNATSSAVDEGVKLARGAHADVVVGLGGVKTLSIAKCIAMVSPTRLEMDDFLSGMQPQGKPLPYIALPTTCRDPFLLVDDYLVTDSRDRTARIGKTQPGITKIALVDPKLCATLPVKYTATTLMDTLLSAVEGYISTRSNCLSDTFFVRAMELIGRSIRHVVTQPEDLRVRMNAAMAGLLTALGLTMGKQGIGTALAYAINGRFMVPKSWISEKLARLAQLLGEEITDQDPVDAADKAVQAVRRLIVSLGLPTRLRDFDLNLDDMVDIAGTARGFDMMNYLPRPISTDDIYELIKSAF